MNRPSPARRFFGVLVNKQTYKNIAYLLLSFPLAIVSFVFTVTGVAVGAGLVPILLGLIILFGTFTLEYGFLVLDRTLAAALLDVEPVPLTLKKTGNGAWRTIKARITDALLWKGLLYVAAKLFLTVFTFAVEIALLSLSVTLAFLPLFLLIRRGDFLDVYIAQAWNYPVLIVCAVIAGLFVTFVTLHAGNGLAALHRKLVAVMPKRLP